MAQQIIISTDDDRFYGSEAAPENADEAHAEYRRLVSEEIASYYPEAAVEFRWEHGARACAVFGVEDLAEEEKIEGRVRDIIEQIYGQGEFWNAETKP